MRKLRRNGPDWGPSRALRSAAARELAPAAHGRLPKETSERRACSSFRDDARLATQKVDGPAGRGPRRTSVGPFILINLFLAISSIIVTIITITQGTVAGQVDTGGSYGLFYLATFTMGSNILLGVVALIAVIITLKSLKTEQPLNPNLTTWYLIATTAAVLTFLTVVLFLAPRRAMQGHNPFDMLTGPMFFFHFFNPVLASINLTFFAPATKLTKGDRLLATLPMDLYAIPYFFAVVVFEACPDFYGFTFGGHNWAIIPSFLVMSALVFTISSTLAHFHNRRLKNS